MDKLSISTISNVGVLTGQGTNAALEEPAAFWLDSAIFLG